MAGGDGSQALVAGVAMAADVPLVCVPAGTRNRFALDLGLDRNDVVAALDAFDAAVERRIDLGEVNGRVFVNNVSLGVYAKIVQSPEYRDAKRQTTTAMLSELFGPGAEPFDLHFVGPDGARRDGARIIQVSNNPYRLTSLNGFGSRARLDTGELGVAAPRSAAPGTSPRSSPPQWFGRLDRFRGWTRGRPHPHDRVERPDRGGGRRRGVGVRSAAGVPEPAGRAPRPHPDLGARLLARRSRERRRRGGR